MARDQRRAPGAASLCAFLLRFHRKVQTSSDFGRGPCRCAPTLARWCPPASPDGAVLDVATDARRALHLPRRRGVRARGLDAYGGRARAGLDGLAEGAMYVPAPAIPHRAAVCFRLECEQRARSSLGWGRRIAERRPAREAGLAHPDRRAAQHRLREAPATALTCTSGPTPASNASSGRVRFRGRPHNVKRRAAIAKSGQLIQDRARRSDLTWQPERVLIASASGPCGWRFRAAMPLARRCLAITVQH